MIRDLVVEVVSPTMVGGARNEVDDPPTLRPPSVRGQLRFWARALGNEDLERRLWGDVERGQRVRLIGAQRLDGEPRPAYFLPHEHGGRRAETKMVPPGDRVLLRFALPDIELLPAVQANVWSWLHLGAIGRRSRRGYGSLLWEPHPGHLLDGFLEAPLDRWSDLESSQSLEAYLRRGLAAVFRTLGLADRQERSSRAGGSSGDFAFDSLDQVFVGRQIVSGKEFKWHVARSSSPGPESTDGSLEYLLHGLGERARGSAPHPDQLGHGSSNPPSPMMWRVFPMPTAEEGHVVVMTWSPINYGAATPLIDRVTAPRLAEYLEDKLRLHTSLAGQPLLTGSSR